MPRYQYNDLETAAEAEYPNSAAAPDYDATNETSFERTAVRCVGASCFVLLSTLAFVWAVHAAPLGWVSDAPSFARSLLWRSLAHHTDQYRDHFGNYPPPPPQFGDGRGNF
jgi:hypothetical protein